jgi:hypothetical protein
MAPFTHRKCVHASGRRDDRELATTGSKYDSACRALDFFDDYEGVIPCR